MNLNEIRPALLNVLQLVPSSWNVVDEAQPGFEVHPPCALLSYRSAVSHTSFGSRMATFTIKLIIDPAAELNQYAELLNAIGDDGLVDEMVSAFAAPNSAWDSVIVDTSITVEDEQAGQIVAPFAEVRLEVYG